MERPEMALSKEDLIEEIKGMSVLDLADVVKALEEEFGVSAAAPVAVAPPPGASGGEVAAAEEKDEFDVELTAAGDAADLLAGGGAAGGQPVATPGLVLAVDALLRGQLGL